MLINGAVFMSPILHKEAVAAITRCTNTIILKEACLNFYILERTV